MTKIDPPFLSRRDLLKSTGALVVVIAAPKELHAAVATATAGDGKPPLAPDQLDSWIAVHPDGSVTAFFGKVDLGQSLDIAIGQIVADELDVSFEKVTVVMGDTATTVNQGGASGSTGVQRGGIALRNAAAEARRLLVDMAAQKLGVAAETLTVTGGIVSAKGESATRISYGELIGGNYFHETLQWNGKLGNNLVASGKAKPKRPDDYRVVGRPIPRRDIAEKVFARMTYVTDVKVPGMMHGRMIRPPVAGSMPVAVDEASVRDIPGVRVVRNKGFLGVVAEKEWNAILASQQLKVTWSDVQAPFPPQAELYDHIRTAPVRGHKIEHDKGEVQSALSGAVRTVEAEYEWPFQSHSSMGPACAVVDARGSEVMVWTGSQKPHYAREGVAKILQVPPEKVRAIWIQGPGSYGRNDAGDASIDAAVLSQAVGRPVRVQGMRYEGHGWDPKGPASIHRGRAGLDAQGNVVAYWFESKGFSRIDIATNESDPRDSLAGQLMGMPLDSHDGFGAPEESYGFANKRLSWETIAPLLDRASPLRTAHLRDPVGPQIHFASESFIDELAVATNTDAVAFRLRHLEDPRDVAAVKAAAERAGWQTRPSGPKGRAQGETAVGRGIAYAKRGQTVVAVVAEIEVERKSGRVWPKRYVVAHDCGLIVNPEGLRYCIEGNLIHASSRALREEVTFDARNVTSVDWRTYPILGIADAPEKVEVVLINRPELPPSGAGEPSSRPVAAALANAIFDATGVRLRQAPFTPARVKASLV